MKTLLDYIGLRHRPEQAKIRFKKIEKLLCCPSRELTTYCWRSTDRKRRARGRPRLTDEEKAMRIKEINERRYAALKMDGIGRRDFRKSGIDEKTQAEWRNWWSIKTRHSARMCDAASAIWLLKRGQDAKLHHRVMRKWSGRGGANKRTSLP